MMIQILFAFAAGALMHALAERLGGVMTRVDALSRRAGAGNAGGFALGLALGVLWTPCAGPVLGSILTLIATAMDLGWAATLLGCYALGAGIPMILIGYGGRYATTRVRRLAHYASTAQRAFGVLIIAIAAATALQLDTAAMAWLSQFLPEGASPLLRICFLPRAAVRSSP
jgi:cytochrome c biogenesis protein CcdA